MDNVGNFSEESIGGSANQCNGSRRDQCQSIRNKLRRKSGIVGISTFAGSQEVDVPGTSGGSGVAGENGKPYGFR